ncbi:MAG: hypothetical protein HY744_04465 [Deltaproteobacteria bacterium]|nr:hypothetical protein [Deltaproteobacteria bacterium]
MNRAFVFARPFVHDYRALSDDIRNAVDKALRLLLESPRHPSLRVKKMQPKSRGIFEARVTQDYRMTFHIDGRNLVMRRVGTHSILRAP